MNLNACLGLFKVEHFLQWIFSRISLFLEYTDVWKEEWLARCCSVVFLQPHLWTSQCGCSLLGSILWCLCLLVCLFFFKQWFPMAYWWVVPKHVPQCLSGCLRVTPSSCAAQRLPPHRSTLTCMWLGRSKVDRLGGTSYLWLMRANSSQVQAMRSATVMEISVWTREQMTRISYLYPRPHQWMGVPTGVLWASGWEEQIAHGRRFRRRAWRSQVWQSNGLVSVTGGLGSQLVATALLCPDCDTLRLEIG